MSDPTPTSPPSATLARSVLGESMVTMRDIAEFCGVHYRCVQDWRAKGLLPPPDFVLGKVVRWRQRTIEKFIASRAGQSRERSQP